MCSWKGSKSTSLLILDGGEISESTHNRQVEWLNELDMYVNSTPRTSRKVGN